MLELEDIPGRDFKPSIRTLFEKIIHFNCPLKLGNHFISFREPISYLILSCLLAARDTLKLLNEQFLYIYIYIIGSSKTALTILLKIGVLIKSHELLVVHKF